MKYDVVQVQWDHRSQEDVGELEKAGATVSTTSGAEDTFSDGRDDDSRLERNSGVEDERTGNESSYASGSITTNMDSLTRDSSSNQQSRAEDTSVKKSDPPLFGASSRKKSIAFKNIEADPTSSKDVNETIEDAEKVPQDDRTDVSESSYKKSYGGATYSSKVSNLTSLEDENFIRAQDQQEVSLSTFQDMSTGSTTVEQSSFGETFQESSLGDTFQESSLGDTFHDISTVGTPKESSLGDEQSTKQLSLGDEQSTKQLSLGDEQSTKQLSLADKQSTDKKTAHDDNAYLSNIYSLASLGTHTDESVDILTIGSFLFQFPGGEKEPEKKLVDDKGSNEVPQEGLVDAENQDGDKVMNACDATKSEHSVSKTGHDPIENSETATKTSSPADQNPATSTASHNEHHGRASVSSSFVEQVTTPDNISSSQCTATLSDTKVQEVCSKLDAFAGKTESQPSLQDFEGILKDLESVCDKEHPAESAESKKNDSSFSETDVSTAVPVDVEEESVKETLIPLSSKGEEEPIQETLIPLPSKNPQTSTPRRKFRMKQFFCLLRPCSNRKSVLETIEQEEEEVGAEEVVEEAEGFSTDLGEGTTSRDLIEQTRSVEVGFAFSQTRSIEVERPSEHSTKAHSRATDDLAAYQPTETSPEKTIKPVVKPANRINTSSRKWDPSGWSVLKTRSRSLKGANEVERCSSQGSEIDEYEPQPAPMRTSRRRDPSPVRTPRRRDPYGNYRAADVRDIIAASKSRSESEVGKNESWISSRSMETSTDYTRGSATFFSTSEESDYSEDSRSVDPSVRSFVDVKEATDYDLFADAKLFVKNLGFLQDGAEDQKKPAAAGAVTENSLVNPISSLFGELKDILDLNFVPPSQNQNVLNLFVPNTSGTHTSTTRGTSRERHQETARDSTNNYNGGTIRTPTNHGGSSTTRANYGGASTTRTNYGGASTTRTNYGGTGTVRREQHMKKRGAADFHN